jgi:hypothetical protein
MPKVEKSEFGKDFWNGIIRNIVALIFVGFAYVYRLNNPEGLKTHTLQSDRQLFSLLLTYFSDSNNFSSNITNLRLIIGFREEL